MFSASNHHTEEELGYFTARIPVMTQGKEVFSVYMFDSEHWDCSTRLGLPGTNCIGSEAISWFMRQQMMASHDYHGRDIVFTH
jgi:hypothetical protein